MLASHEWNVNANPAVSVKTDCKWTLSSRVSLAVIARGYTAALCVHAHAVVASVTYCIYEVFFNLCHAHAHVTTMQLYILLPNLTLCVFCSRCAALYLQLWLACWDLPTLLSYQDSPCCRVPIASHHWDGNTHLKSWVAGSGITQSNLHTF